MWDVGHSVRAIIVAGPLGTCLMRQGHGDRYTCIQ